LGVFDSQCRVLVLPPGYDRPILREGYELRTNIVAYQQWPISETEHDAVEDDGADDDVGAFPAVVFDEERAKRSEDERANAGTTDRHAGSKGSLLVEVIADHHNRRQVHQTETGT